LLRSTQQATTGTRATSPGATVQIAQAMQQITRIVSAQTAGWNMMSLRW
jgi:hypothetical protein